MWTWILDNSAAICSFVVAVLSFVLSIMTKRGINANSDGFAGSAYTALKSALRVLPNYITFSEDINKGKTGEEKKAFVMTFIESMYAGRGLELDDDSRAEISTYIDNIVAATKLIHTNGKDNKNEENKRNDISGITGLRVES